jgi:hypothetical protein
MFKIMKMYFDVLSMVIGSAALLPLDYRMLYSFNDSWFI